LRETGDRLTGGGLRNLAQQSLRRLRDAGDWLTGGGLRALGKRILTASLLRTLRQQPALKALGCGVPQALPDLSQPLCRLATEPDTVLTTSDIANVTWPSSAQVKEYRLLAHSLYRAAFGRLADPGELATRIRQLQSGVSVQALTEELVASTEFQARHPLSQRVDIEFVETLYRDGLGRKPDPEGLAGWLAEAEEGATRAKVLAGLAGSGEATRAVATALVNSLFQTALGRSADEDGLAICVHQLQSGSSPEALAEALVASAKFRARHGSSQKVDTEYLTALYRDGLGRKPDPEGLAHWLTAGQKGTTRAKALAGFAASTEALQRVIASANSSNIDNAAFGHLADRQSVVSSESLAEELVGSAETRIRHRSSQKVEMGPVFLFGTGRCGSTHLQRLITLNTEVWVWGEHDGFLEPLLTGLIAYENSVSLRRFVFDTQIPEDDAQLIDLVRREGRDLSWLNRHQPSDLRIELRRLLERFFSRGVPQGYTSWGFKEIRYGGWNKIPEYLLNIFPECSMAFIFREPSATFRSMLRNSYIDRLEPERLGELPGLYKKLVESWVQVLEYFVGLKRAQPGSIVMLEVGHLNCPPEQILELLRLRPRSGVACVTQNITNRGSVDVSDVAERAVATCFARWRRETTALYEAALALCDLGPITLTSLPVNSAE
jgi:hypothetical protein